MTDPFRIRAHVPDFDGISAEYRQMSDRARATITSRRDLAYGNHPDERLDLFYPARREGPIPAHVYIHGGYWRASNKEDYAFVAAPIVAAGAAAVIVEYTLMPKARMSHIVDQVRRAVRWVGVHAGELGIDPARLSASGHSAGAHLAFYLGARGASEADFPETGIASLLLLSGIYDLAPIAASFLQQEIGLTADEIAAWSPLSAELRPGIGAHLMVGAAETAPFLDQADALAARHGLGLTSLDGLNHMTIVRAYGVPGTPAAAHIGRTIAGVDGI